MLRREESCAQVHNIGSKDEAPVKMVSCPLTPREDEKWILSEVKMSKLLH